MADADQMADVLDPFEAAARRVRQGVRPEAGRQAGAATHVIENYLPYALGKAASLPQRATEAAGMLQRQGDVYDPAPALETAQMMMGRTPFPESGSAGVFGGMLAKTADIPTLHKAKDMMIDRTQRFQEGTLPQGGERIIHNRINNPIWNETGWGLGTDGKPRFEIPDALSHLKPDFHKYGAAEGGGVPLGAALEHPKLFEAYPELGNIDVKVGKLGGNAKGVYRGYSGDNSIGISSALEPHQARSTLLHEIQHAIQHKEDFAPGNNPNWIVNHYAKNTSNDRWADLVKNFGGWEPAAEAMNSAAHKVYSRHAGEVEARNVQRRADMGSSGRAIAGAPWNTQDIARPNQVIPHTWTVRQSPGIQSYVKALLGIKE